MRVQIEVDVADAESVSQAREMAFELVRPLLNPSKKRGPKTSGPRAIVIGVSVSQPQEFRVEGDSVVSVDVTE